MDDANRNQRPALRSLLAALLLVCLLVWPQTEGGARAQEGRGAGARPSADARRVALIIGNADYDASVGRLRNPVNDALDVASALTRLGFELVGGKAHLNLNKREMLELIREFGGRISAGGVAVFYFAGHGVQVEKRNYLIPITGALRFQEDAQFEAVEVDQVLGEMEHAEDALNMLILDACRNNNLPRKTRDARHGLGEPQRRPPSGVLIAFAARDGQTAQDNPDGRNGLYTQELLKNLETPNLRLEDIFINTRRAVKRLSNKRQEPIEYGSLDDIYYLKADESAASQPPPRPSTVMKVGRATFNFANSEGPYVDRRIGEKQYEFITTWSQYNSSAVYLYIYHFKTLSKIPRETIPRDATDAARFPHTKYRAEILKVGDKAVVSNESGKYAVIQVTDVRYSGTSKEVEFTYEIFND
ncbi:MAG TPA: caspase family protein [Pyrinomonadaceae bacterium]